MKRRNIQSAQGLSENSAVLRGRRKITVAVRPLLSTRGEKKCTSPLLFSLPIACPYPQTPTPPAPLPQKLTLNCQGEPLWKGVAQVLKITLATPSLLFLLKGGGLGGWEPKEWG